MRLSSHDFSVIRFGANSTAPHLVTLDPNR
jgi:hypothetical protein